MKTAKPLTDTQYKAFQDEPQTTFFAHSMGRSVTVPTRIHSRIEIVDTCWRVFGWNSDNGFANIGLSGKTIKVHRAVFELCVRRLEKGEVLDHKKVVCQFRDCCNFDHLEPVTVRENTHRGKAILYAARV